jgi:phage baseplate assembly protein V
MDKRFLKQINDKVRNSSATRLNLKMVNDGSKMQSIQATGLDGEVFESVERFEPYGFTSHPKGGEAIGLPIGGDRSHMIVLNPGDRGVRKGGGAPGDVVMYNENGDSISLGEGNKLAMKTKELSADAETTVVIKTKDLTIEASGSVTIKSPTVTIEGNLVVTGSITGGGGGQAVSIDGDMSVKGDVTTKGDVAVDGNVTATGSITGN